MLRVTVMMLRDMVESVTLLKEEAWRGQRAHTHIMTHTHHNS